MQLTNQYGLPEPLVAAIANDSYDSGWRPEFGNRYISATQLCRPPQLNRLVKRHWQEIQEDATERVWSLMGQSTHEICKRAALTFSQAIAERRFHGRIRNWHVSGQVDLFQEPDGSLFDFKVTSVWSALDKNKASWEQQLNVLAWLLRENLYSVSSVAIIAILRDHSRRKARYEAKHGYPQQPVLMLPLPLWTHEQASEWLQLRLAEEEAAEPRLCTDEERWLRGGGYAARKPRNKRATKLFEDLETAEAWLKQQGPKAGYVLEGREGVYHRCENYCPARAFCQQAGGEF